MRRESVAVKRRALAAAGIAILSFVGFSDLAAQPPELILSVPDTVVTPGQVGALLNVRMSNYFDTVAGFQFVLKSQRPDVVTFDFQNGGFDTNGTLVSGFEFVQAIDRSGDGSEIWFRCIANLPFDTVHNWGVPPQQGGIAVRIPFNTVAYIDSTVVSAISIIKPTDFSDPWGTSIGVVTETLYDTTFYLCNLWQNDTCLQWIVVDPNLSAYDSLSVDASLYGYLDTTRVILQNGSITVTKLPVPCDFDGDDRITIADLTQLVECLFGAPLSPPGACDALCDPDRSGSLNVADLTYLVAFLFNGGPPPL
ncbi:MAG TPA: hypothetical protein VN285_05460 [Candidatus Deferrimicrobium sp.]|nr:hypothetical protein [Candidatus Deferrimicrobium sp.]